MLILSRKKGESIIINGNIEITIADIQDGKVRIGIEAPKDVDIHRREVYEAIQKENKEAISNKNVNLNIFKEIFKKIKNILKILFKTPISILRRQGSLQNKIQGGNYNEN
ncbi:carbon storage regulator [Gottschalkia acidurici 9a]|uniref:Translational regulator CsrA n=1 Tax=Gottschalkia acidurici (strain ATCC 7906 / DSM 604 / BCRC 14475 / CIP 104303 / KCTC 5404 / NCIMB 10678 / 9a) TaxID=1128398 RepID=K0AY67_GOTA9|nr:carbon storage regulator CsrA [Gottschalkia acidurici]AFS77326.1 carbon storage regulator [Gottschalkia acidurici 9a]